MMALDWISLSESFGSFKGKASDLGLFSNELAYIETEIAKLCPIPVNNTGNKNPIGDLDTLPELEEIDGDDIFEEDS